MPERKWPAVKPRRMLSILLDHARWLSTVPEEGVAYADRVSRTHICGVARVFMPNMLYSEDEHAIDVLDKFDAFIEHLCKKAVRFRIKTEDGLETRPTSLYQLARVCRRTENCYGREGILHIIEDVQEFADTLLE